MFKPVFKNNRQKALEELLNDSVEPLCLGLYKWRNRYHEVRPYRWTLTHHNWSGFIAYTYKNKLYMMREASNDNIRKYFPKVWEKIEVERSVKFNRSFIQKGKL